MHLLLHASPCEQLGLLIGWICTVCAAPASRQHTPLPLRPSFPPLQHDNLVPTMTSWEALSFYAGLVLPANTSADKKRARIHDVLSMMGLAKHRDTLVRTHTGSEDTLTRQGTA